MLPIKDLILPIEDLMLPIEDFCPGGRIKKHYEINRMSMFDLGY